MLSKTSTDSQSMANTYKKFHGTRKYQWLNVQGDQNIGRNSFCIFSGV